MNFNTVIIFLLLIFINQAFPDLSTDLPTTRCNERLKGKNRNQRNCTSWFLHPFWWLLYLQFCNDHSSNSEFYFLMFCSSLIYFDAISLRVDSFFCLFKSIYLFIVSFCNTIIKIIWKKENSNFIHCKIFSIYFPRNRRWHFMSMSYWKKNRRFSFFT